MKKIGIIFGGTEFPLILKESEYAGIPVLNITRIHIKEIINFLKKQNKMNGLIL